jgi:asparagine synthase (glutamine-hydrolysing)
VGSAVSGFVGIFHLDGSPVDPRLLRHLTNSLSFRGPDAQEIWRDGPIGLGHTLLQIRSGVPLERQPAQLDGRLWIAADARIDARAELIAELKSKRRGAEALSESSPDAELILHAYSVWGEACVEHLLGDFSFALWDARENRLFCARDHFGFRLFFYARAGNSLIFSNTLDCLRLHPGISDRLNDLAIADFLMYSSNSDLGTSAFADIQRLPPAHTLRCSSEKIEISRYWTLAESAPLQANPQECIDAFQEIFDSAVSDRLRANSAGLNLSGGLDSPTVAISARRVSNHRDTPLDLRAVNYYFDKLIPHEEMHYSGLVAKSLHLPIHFVNGDDCHLFDLYDDPNFRTPEPMHYAMGCRNADPAKEIAAFSRVALAGFGGDPALACLLTAHFSRLFKARKYGRMFLDAFQYLTAEGRSSRLYLRTRYLRRFGPEQSDEFPVWLNPEFEKRLGLRDRWDGAMSESNVNHSARPEAYELVAAPVWTSLIESEDASVSGSLVEVGYPFFDLRVLKFLLSLPALPLCSDKEILRRAARGIIPDAVRLRRKSPLIADPISALLQKPESEWVDRFETTPELSEYVQRDRIPRVFNTDDAFGALVQLRPLSLNLWLQRRSSISYI